MAMHAAHFLCADGTLQKPIATSSGDSEFYGIFKACLRSIVLGAKKVCDVHADATAIAYGPCCWNPQ